MSACTQVYNLYMLQFKPELFLLVIRRDLESMTHHPRYTYTREGDAI